MRRIYEHMVIGFGVAMYSVLNAPLLGVETFSSHVIAHKKVYAAGIIIGAVALIVALI